MGICVTKEDPPAYESKQPQPNAHKSKSLQLKDFKIMKIIGMGSFGKVYKVTKVNSPAQYYAMKVLDKGILIQQNQIVYTNTERKVLESVQSNFLVHLCYAFQSDERLYMIMDYMGGGELFYYLHQKGTFKEPEIRFYAAEIYIGLTDLHKKNIIYRDLKPQNILLDDEGHIKITDFGLSKMVSASSNDRAYTMCGTLDYLAPEVIKEVGHNKSADWWSFVHI